jgi:putative inorganic carbon (HCO3(-)) transporter
MNGVTYTKFEWNFGLTLTGVAVIPFFFASFELIPGGHHNNQRAIQLAVLLASLLYAMEGVFRGKLTRPSSIRASWWFCGGFFFFGALSAIQSAFRLQAFLEWNLFFSLLVLSYLIAVEVRKNPLEQIKKILRILGVGTALYACASTVPLVSALLLKAQPSLVDLIPGFDNWRFLNHTQTVILPLLGLLLVIDSPRSKVEDADTQASSLISLWRKYRYWLWWYAISVSWMLVFVSGARGTGVGMGVSIATIFFLLQKKAWPWCRVMLLAALFGALGNFLLYTVAPLAIGLRPFGSLGEVAVRTATNPDSGRIALWHIAIGLIKAYPWLGSGPMHFAHYSRGMRLPAHPHNWILQIASEWGFVALICFCAVLYLSLRRLFRTARTVASDDWDNQAISVAFLAVLIALICDGLVSGLLVMPVSQLWIAIYVGCAWGWTESRQSENLAVGSTRKMDAPLRILLSSLLIALMLNFVHAFWVQIWGSGAEQQSEHIKNDDERWPRFWIYGNF